jgi:S1-C subfamily serine protease
MKRIALVALLLVTPLHAQDQSSKVDRFSKILQQLSQTPKRLDKIHKDIKGILQAPIKSHQKQALPKQKQVPLQPGTHSSNPMPPSAVLEQRKNVCRISVSNGNGSSSLGTGVYIGSGLVYTCSHLWTRATDRNLVVVTFFTPHRQVLKGRLLTRDSYYDTGLVKLDVQPCCLPGVELTKSMPRVGEDLFTAGATSRNSRGLPGFRYGRIQKYEQVDGSTGRPNGISDWATISPAMALGGDSGGPVFNRRGKLVGNLHRASPGQTVIVLPGRTKRFLLPWNAKLEAHRLGVRTGQSIVP